MGNAKFVHSTNLPRQPLCAKPVATGRPSLWCAHAETFTVEYSVAPPGSCRPPRPSPLSGVLVGRYHPQRRCGGGAPRERGGLGSPPMGSKRGRESGPPKLNLTSGSSAPPKLPFGAVDNSCSILAGTPGDPPNRPETVFGHPGSDSGGLPGTPRIRSSGVGFAGLRARPGIQNPEFRIASGPLRNDDLRSHIGSILA